MAWDQHINDANWKAFFCCYWYTHFVRAANIMRRDFRYFTLTISNEIKWKSSDIFMSYSKKKKMLWFCWWNDNDTRNDYLFYLPLIVNCWIVHVICRHWRLDIIDECKRFVCDSSGNCILNPFEKWMVSIGKKQVEKVWVFLIELVSINGIVKYWVRCHALAVVIISR